MVKVSALLLLITFVANLQLYSLFSVSEHPMQAGSTVQSLNNFLCVPCACVCVGGGGGGVGARPPPPPPTQLDFGSAEVWKGDWESEVKDYCTL